MLARFADANVGGKLDTARQNTGSKTARRMCSITVASLRSGWDGRTAPGDTIRGGVTP